MLHGLILCCSSGFASLTDGRSLLQGYTIRHGYQRASYSVPVSLIRIGNSRVKTQPCSRFGGAAAGVSGTSDRIISRPFERSSTRPITGFVEGFKEPINFSKRQSSQQSAASLS